MLDPLANKVLLVGWDAADWRMIRPLLDRGEMPALASLMKRGAWGNLATIRPMLSPMLWTSIATGKRADKHGIYGFVEPKPDATGIRPVSSTSRHCKAIWNIAAQNGLRSCVVNWFASHPAEPVPGSVVSDAYFSLIQPGVGQPDLPEASVHPQELRGPLSRLMVDPAEIDGATLQAFVPRAAEIDQSRDPRLLHLATLLARAASVQAASRFCLENTDWDLGCVLFGAIDEFGHHFMPFHPPVLPGVDPKDADLYRDVMVGCYRFQDLMLQSMLEAAGPDTTTIVVSDHGFYHDQSRPSIRADENPEAWHRPYGIAAMAGPGVRPGQRLHGASLLDVTPTILYLLGLPVGADMDGRPWVELIDTDRPAQQIISWDHVGGKLVSPASSDGLSEASASALAMRHLADLGYLDLGAESVQEQIDKVIREQKVNLARALTDSRRVAKAVDIWAALVEDQPQNTVFRIEFARSLLLAGQPQRAVEILSAVDRHDGARLLRTDALLKTNQTELARAELRDLAERHPDDAAVLSRLGRLQLSSGQHEEAGRLLCRARELEPQNPAVMESLSRWACDAGDYNAAIDHALEAISLAHHFPRAHYRLGCALAGRGEVAQAIQAFEVCLQQAGHFTAAHQKLASLLPPGPEADRHAMLASSYQSASHSL